MTVETKPDGRRSFWPLALRLGLLAVVVGGGAYAAWRSGLTSELSIDRLRATIGAAGPLGVVLYAGAFALGELIYIPAIVFIALAPALYGKFLGAVYALGAGLFSAAVGFAVGRFFGAGLSSRARWLERLDERLTTRGVRTVIYLRIIFLLAPYLNMGLGFTRLRWRDYLLGTLLGITPAVLLLTFVFHDVLVAGKSPFSLTVILPVAALVGLGLFALLRKRRLVGSAQEGADRETKETENG